MKVYLYFLFITLLFIIYVEYSVGGIVFRVNSSGFTSFQPSNIIYYLLNPLHNKFLWHRQLLDVNFPFILIISSFGYFLSNLYL